MADPPKLRGQLDLSLPLTPEEGFVLSRVDGAASAEQIAITSGLPREAVERALGRLAELGAIEAGTVAGTGTDTATTTDTGSDTPTETDTSTESDDAADDTAAPEETTHRQRFEQHFRSMTADERMARARDAETADLLALCFDPDPKVIHAILENARVSLEHARLVAAHHANPAGIDHLLRRADFSRDAQVMRRLFRNPQASDAQLKKLLEPKTLRYVYTTTANANYGERARRIARDLMAGKFNRADPKERFDFIVSTEGRPLMMLTNAPFDARTTQLFCARTITSPLLIQNLAKWRPCPPQVLAHLLKHNLVQHQTALKRLVLAHPNVPASARRGG